jgi:hypothetical protein
MPEDLDTLCFTNCAINVEPILDKLSKVVGEPPIPMLILYAGL